MIRNNTVKHRTMFTSSNTTGDQTAERLIFCRCPRDKTFRFETGLLKEQVSSGVFPEHFQTLFSFEPLLFKSEQDKVSSEYPAKFATPVSFLVYVTDQ